MALCGGLLLLHVALVSAAGTANSRGAEVVLDAGGDYDALRLAKAVGALEPSLLPELVGLDAIVGAGGEVRASDPDRLGQAMGSEPSDGPAARFDTYAVEPGWADGDVSEGSWAHASEAGDMKATADGVKASRTREKEVDGEDGPTGEAKATPAEVSTAARAKVAEEDKPPEVSAENKAPAEKAPEAEESPDAEVKASATHPEEHPNKMGLKADDLPVGEADPGDVQRHGHHGHMVWVDDDAKAEMDGKTAYDMIAIPCAGSTPSGPVTVGSQQTVVNVVYDTGSDKAVLKTWATAEAMLNSMDGGLEAAIKSTGLLYQNSASKTYVAEMTEDPDGNKMPKRGFIGYGSGFAVTQEGRDTMTLGKREIPSVLISEILKDSLALLHTKAGPSGVLGLQHMKNNAKSTSIFRMARDAGKMAAFGYCRATDQTSTFLWGDNHKDGHAVDVVGEIHWGTKLGNVQIKWKPGQKPHEEDKEEPATPHGKAPRFVEVEENEPLCPDGSCASIIDTGSNIIAGPAKVVQSLVQQLGVKRDCSNFASLPDIEMTLGDYPVTIPASAYIMKIKMPSWIKKLRAALGGRRHKHKEWSEGEAPHREWSEAQLPDEEPVPADSLLDTALADMSEDLGFDLGTALGLASSALAAELGEAHGHEVLENIIPEETEELCMPAFVPLDKKTAHGPLWVVGTPLFANYYTRFSWPRSEASPKIYFSKLAEAPACKDLPKAPAAKPEEPPPPADASGGGGGDADAPPGAASVAEGTGGRLMRAESRAAAAGAAGAKAKAAAAATPGPLQRDFEDIQFPTWVRHMEVF